MGNRAVIKTQTGHIGIYLHWNGGRDSVEAFLTYCKLKGYRSPETDGYGWARLAQVIGNYFGGGLSVGMVEVNANGCLSGDGEGCDNGCYVIRDWEIVDRQDFEGREQDNYDLVEFMLDIDKSMPESERIGDLINSKEIATTDLCVGDTVVFLNNITGLMETSEVVGFGSEHYVNGTMVLGLPYMNRYHSENPEKNINNYIRTETVRVRRSAG